MSLTLECMWWNTLAANCLPPFFAALTQPQVEWMRFSMRMLVYTYCDPITEFQQVPTNSLALPGAPSRSRSRWHGCAPSTDPPATGHALATSPCAAPGNGKLDGFQCTGASTARSLPRSPRAPFRRRTRPCQCRRSHTRPRYGHRRNEAPILQGDRN